PVIVAFCCIGVFSMTNATFGIYQIAIAGVVGYVLTKLDCEVPPFILGFVLGPMLEEHFRRAMLISHGDISVFVMRPLSAVLLVISVIVLVVVMVPAVTKKREEVFVEED